MNKLKKIQLMRNMEANDIARQKYLAEVNSALDNADDCKEQTTNCAKQSQSDPGQIGVTSLLQDTYQNISHPVRRENKAKQTQYEPASCLKGAGSIHCSSKAQGGLTFR